MTQISARPNLALAHTDPLIWRRADVPADPSLKILHDIIESAIG